MPQALEPPRERRDEERRPAAFAFWFGPAGSNRRSSAWMFEFSDSAAAFLTAADNAPNVGQRLELAEMFSMDRLVREGCPGLPHFARVVRVGTGDGVTRHVAVRFEADDSVQLPASRPGQLVATCSERSLPPMPVPPPAANGMAAAPALMVLQQH